MITILKLLRSGDVLELTLDDLSEKNVSKIRDVFSASPPDFATFIFCENVDDLSWEHYESFLLLQAEVHLARKESMIRMANALFENSILAYVDLYYFFVGNEDKSKVEDIEFDAILKNLKNFADLLKERINDAF